MEEVPFRDDSEWLHAGRFGAPAPLLAAHLGAGTAAKRWPRSHWKTLIGRFLDDGWRVVVIGGPEDADAATVLEPHPRLRDWTGALTVPETTAFLERADLFLGADSGPSHLAACAGTPSVVLFSGTNHPAQWRPWSRRSLVLKFDVACRPCHHKVCPLDDHPCMTGLDPDRVYRAAGRWWARLHQTESPHAPL
jgi:ADP-heptose:LPS heptosyltransferase